MPMRTGHRRRPSIRAWARRTGILAMFAAFAVAALVGPAQASKLSDKRAQAAVIERQLNAMDVRLEASIDARISKVLARLVAQKEFKRTPAGNPLAQLTASRSIDVSRDARD